MYMYVQSMLIALGILLSISLSSSVPPPSSSNELLIGAFNVQRFGKTKTEKEDVMNHLVKIIRRYDVILIQEIIDEKGTALQRLIDELNRGQQHKFTAITSDSLGTTTYKEKYSFLIRSDSGVTVTDTYQYPYPNKPGQFSFERPPFSVRLRSTKLPAVTEFVLTAIHTKPTAAKLEIKALKQVHTVLKNRWNTDNILIMGDLNAGCTYATVADLDNLPIRQDRTFVWLIPDNMYTTPTGCAYDRFIMTGQQLRNKLVFGSPGVFRYDLVLRLTPAQAKAVSDHYPIQLRLA